MLDDMLDYAANIRERPVWSPIPDGVRARFREELPHAPTGLDEVYREFTDFIVPYATGNVHPGFMGWVQGGGSAVGMLAEMLAAGLNANLGGRDQMPIEVERQIVEWTRAMFGFPDGASGVFVTGTSMANFMAVLVARTAALGHVGPATRRRRRRARADGLYIGGGAWLHLEGDGSCRFRQRCLAMHRGRSMPSHRRRSDCAHAIMADRSAGLKPFLLVGTVGTVDIGAIDDLVALSATVPRGRTVVSHRWRLWRARQCCRRSLRRCWQASNSADSIALDFHKWGQVPYDAGFLLVRDGQQQRDDVCRAGRISAPRNAGPGRGLALALRFRSRTVARLPRAENLVHSEDLRHRKDRRGHLAHLRAGRPSGSADS